MFVFCSLIQFAFFTQLSIHSYNRSFQQKDCQHSPSKRIEIFEEGDQLYVRIRRPLVAADQMWPNLPNQKGFFIFKEIKKAETKVETNNNKKREPKKKSIFVRKDKEKGSVSHFSGGYHISNL